jgi:hypothetical protein
MMAVVKIYSIKHKVHNVCSTLGLLAGLWEFPSLQCNNTQAGESEASCDNILQQNGVIVKGQLTFKDCGEVRY